MTTIFSIEQNKHWPRFKQTNVTCDYELDHIITGSIEETSAILFANYPIVS